MSIQQLVEKIIGSRRLRALNLKSSEVESFREFLVVQLRRLRRKSLERGYEEGFDAGTVRGRINNFRIFDN